MPCAAEPRGRRATRVRPQWQRDVEPQRAAVSRDVADAATRVAQGTRSHRVARGQSVCACAAADEATIRVVLSRANRNAPARRGTANAAPGHMHSMKHTSRGCQTEARGARSRGSCAKG